MVSDSNQSYPGVSDRDDSSPSVVVIGAGISGLCAGYWLKKRGIAVTLLEKDAEPGGTMRTSREEGWLSEAGPNSALETTPLLPQLFGELDILGRRVYAGDAASRRYILRDGLLRAIPMTSSELISTRLLSMKGKLRMMKEPFIGRALEEESVSDFITRRLGHELLDYAIDPFVAGVYAGDPRKLSVQDAFPKIYALESTHGGLIRGMLALRNERKLPENMGIGRARPFSFAEGMQTLPRILADELGDSLLLNTSVEHIIPMRAGRAPVYTVAVRRNGAPESMRAAAVVLASPAHSTGGIIRRIDPETAKILESVYYPPLASVYLGFKREQIAIPLDGFGFLVPGVERRKILGTIWSSEMFPGRAPPGCAALTTFVGGARQPELASLGDDSLSRTVLTELQSIMKIGGDPIFCRINRWERAIPQYNMGYRRVLQAVDRFEQNFRGAFICSSFRGGISVGDCVASAGKISDLIARYLSG